MSSRSVYEAVSGAEDMSGIAKRVAQISVSAIKQMPVLASEVGGCISLGQGIPALNTPEFITEAVIGELRENSAISKYSLQPGVPELKVELARRLERDRGIQNVNPKTEIFVSCGGMEALAAGIATVVERGDEVILPSPTYGSHVEQVLFAEGTPVFVPLLEETEWKLDLDALRKAITPKTKAIILCSPMNPTGAVFTEEELRTVAELAVENNLFVVADEAYDFLVYDNLPSFSLAAIPELKERLIATYSCSKMYCMTGWRVGYMYASERIINQVLKVHDAFAICAPTISQYAALAAFRGTNGNDGPGDVFIRELVEDLSSKRDLICQRLDRLPQLFSYAKPRGAYYVFPRFRMDDMSSMDLALKLLYEAKVITIPGFGFGPTGEQHLRMSFGGTKADINEAFDRIESWASQLSS